MGKPVRIVAGVDFDDETSLTAFRHGVFAIGDTGELHLVHVLDAPSGARAERIAVDADRIDDAYQRLRLWTLEQALDLPLGDAARLASRLWFHVRLGDAAAGIHQVAIDVAADLIVIGTHGARGIERLLLGSVAEKVVREAQVPVLVARPNRLADLPKSPQVEPPRPGVPLDLARADMAASSELIDVTPRRLPHVAGLL